MNRAVRAGWIAVVVLLRLGVALAVAFLVDVTCLRLQAAAWMWITVFSLVVLLPLYPVYIIALSWASDAEGRASRVFRMIAALVAMAGVPALLLGSFSGEVWPIVHFGVVAVVVTLLGRLGTRNAGPAAPEGPGGER